MRCIIIFLLDQTFPLNTAAVGNILLGVVCGLNWLYRVNGV